MCKTPNPAMMRDARIAKSLSFDNVWSELETILLSRQLDLLPFLLNDWLSLLLFIVFFFDRNLDVDWK
jgi:hypothetical protein